MREEKISRNEFLKLPEKDIARIINAKEKPETGIFVPDGTRRMTLAITGKKPGSQEFLTEYLGLTSRYFMNNVAVFFNHGLRTLFVPVISANVFNKSKMPHHNTLRKILELILNSKAWLDFYNKNNIRVKVYGNLNYFKKNNYTAVLDWIEKVTQNTANHNARTLFYGFASSGETGADFLEKVIEFHRDHNRLPVYNEQLEMYYGEQISPARFFIMSTKFTGLGALPPLIANRETRMYFLPAPGIMALTGETYRKILFDLLYCHPGDSRREYDGNDLKYAEQLKNYFLNSQATVLGLSRRIGDFAVPICEPMLEAE
jgi:hypothetical protein